MDSLLKSVCTWMCQGLNLEEEATKKNKKKQNEEEEAEEKEEEEEETHGHTTKTRISTAGGTAQENTRITGHTLNRFYITIV